MRTRLLFVFQTLVLFIAVSGLASAQSGSLHFHVPFAFAVGDQKMPAGDYVIEQEGQMALLLIHGNGHSTVAITIPEGSYSSQSEDAAVTFDRRGAEVYLARVRMPGQPTRLIAAPAAH